MEENRNFWYECPHCKSAHLLLDPTTYATAKSNENVVLNNLTTIKKLPEVKYCSQNCELLDRPLDIVL